MPLTSVTITGADDNTDPQALIDLSAEFPFVEWGILLSASSEGSSRFPTRNWIDNLVNKAWGEPYQVLHVSGHLCGRWVRALLVGELEWKQLPPGIRTIASRFQINTHGEIHRSSVEMYAWIKNFSQPVSHQWIFQLDGVNDHLLYASTYHGIISSGLYDLSHGAGVLPDEWHVSYGMRGYAGGLGPDNVVEQIAKINPVAHGDFWIDMEANVRTDEKADLVKVRQVLKLTAPLIGEKV